MVKPTVISTNHSACVILIDIPFKVCDLTLSSLSSGGNKHCSYEFDNSVVAYALFHQIKSKLEGIPSVMAANKIITMKCGATFDSFIIAIIVPPKVSFANRDVIKAFKFMKPSTLFDRYNDIVRVCGEKADKGAFNDSASKLISALHSSSICYIGKLGKYDSSKLDDAGNKVNIALKSMADVSGSKSKRSIELTNTCDAELDHMTKVSLPRDATGCLVKLFIKSHISAGVYMVGGTMYVDKSVSTKLSKLKGDGKVEPFIAKLSKDKDAGGSIAFACASHACISCTNAKKASVTASEFKRAVQSL